MNLDNLDPDWQLASKHGKASLVGLLPSDKSKQVKWQICPCCSQYIYKDPIPLCINPKQLQFLGFGFPLFYIFLKNCMILLAISICSYNSLSLKQAFDNNYSLCHTDSTTQNRRFLASSSCNTFMVQMSRVQSSVTSQQQILRITSFIIQLLFLIYMRDHITKMDAYYGERDISLGDFSIMLKKLPKQPQIQSKLRQFFNNQFQQPHDIKSLTLLPQYTQVNELNKQRAKIINRLRKPYKKNQFGQEEKRDQQNLRKIDQAILEQVMTSKQLAKKDQLQCQKAILVFNCQQQRQKIIEQFEKMNFSKKGPYFGVGSQRITIKQAPQPKQIIWQNVYVPQQTKLFLYIVAWILSFIILALVTVGAYFIYQYKASNLEEAVNQLHKHQDEIAYQNRYKRAISIVYFSLLFIIFFNKLVMSVLYHKITDIQRHETKSKFQFFFGLRYCLGLFFTTALMTLIVQALVFDNYNSHPYGVVQEQTLMFFLNAVLVPIYWYINPFNLAKKLSRKIHYGKRYLTQRQANILMQQSQYDMGKRYAQIIQTMWFTFLYATLVPIGAFASLLGIGIYYWTDKYNLLRKSSLGNEVSGHVVIASMKLLDFTLILRPIGQIIFDTQIRHGTGLYFNIGMIVIGGIYLVLPLDKMIQFANYENFNLAQKTYQELKRTFKDTYKTQHPICKVIYAQKIKKYNSSKGLVTEQKISIRQHFLQDYSLIENSSRESSKQQHFHTSQIVKSTIKSEL